MKIYDTTHALTKGIVEREVDEPAYHGVVRVGSMRYLRGEGDQWHRTSAGAAFKAEEMRLKKIKSVEKRLAKLKAMKFT